ncbi:MAG: WhiB family transcriptional regulator [Actinobacteria bacterium]|jgi:WhiB family redox-sensing transcriptional regulator|nr:WhiB family transcriptional regulator [Actinomycetota bacterium]
MDHITATTDRLPGRARCADGTGRLANLFFSDDAHDLARAKAICRRCSLAEACRAGALERVEFYGVWGGVLVMEGMIVEDRPRRGRPPRNPKPELVVDEVPLPPHLVA